MNSSFYNSISGVKSFQFAMDVQSNNIANINTIGFKGSTPEISSLFATTLTGAYASYASDNGLGASSQTTAFNMSQGTLENSDNPFDLALQGEGWFGVQGLNGKTYYTRAGQFSADANGNLVDLNGNYLLATSGNNISQTTLDDNTLSKFGTYSNTSTKTSMTPYAVDPIDNIALGSLGTQTKVNLPDLLYYPPVATSKVTYAANLDPTSKIDSVTVPLSTTDFTSSVTPIANKISLSGTTNNTADLQNPKKGDIVLVTFTDKNGKELTTSTQLNDLKEWSISGFDVNGLDTTENLTANVSVVSSQEIANKEHFSVGIIGSDGNKDTLDMTFTKRVPQEQSGTTWDATMSIYSYSEDYVVQQYDATKTYDTSVYNVDTATRTVTKIYDPTKYYVNTSDNKVYKIIDNQTGILKFGGAGQLLSNSLSTLSNGGTPLELNLGTINNFDGLISSTSIKKGSSSSSNGSVEGFLKTYGMDSSGNIVAEFTNGKSSAIAKVAIYHFQNDQGLTSVASNLYEKSSNSGNAIFYTDKNGESFLGSTILNHKLEGSNVSMATALTELIVIQKAFSASAKGITTSDELLQNAINMKN